MRREDLFNAIGMVDDKRLARCEDHRNPDLVTRREDSKMNNGGKYTTKSKRSGMPKVWLIAAVIAAMVFMMGCAWGVIEIAGSWLFDYPLTESTDVAPEDIHLSASDVTSTMMHITCSIDGMEPNGEQAIYILENGPFTLEKKTDEGWEALPVKAEDPEWDADEVLTDGNTDWYVDWSTTYGILEPGTYRYTATVLEGNVPASVEFTVDETENKNLTETLQSILNSDYYCIRYTDVTEFGSFDNLTNNEKEFLISEYGDQSFYEFWKSGEDLLVLMYKEDHLWLGMMYKDGMKYILDHEGDDRTNAVIGWSPWPDMDMNRLTWWVSLLTDHESVWDAKYTSDGILESITRTTYSEKFQDNYNVEASYVETFEFLALDGAEASAKFAEQNVDTAQEFSWEEDEQNLKALDVEFVNTSAQPISTASEAIERAKAECTVEHDKIIVYRDEEAGMWKVEFQILYGYQGYQYIYLDDNGITQMISGAGSKVPEWQNEYPAP